MAHLTPTPVLEPGQDRTMILNMGPQHPSTHGVLRVLLEIDGENVVRIMPDIGYLHTGHREDLRGEVLSAGGAADRPHRLSLPHDQQSLLRAGGGETAGAGDSAEGAVAAGFDE